MSHTSSAPVKRGSEMTLSKTQKQLEQAEQIIREIQKRRNEILPNKIQRLKDAIFVKGLVNDENQKKQITELKGMITALEWELEELQSIFQKMGSEQK